MAEEFPSVVISMGNHIASRVISDDDLEPLAGRWELSGPSPGVFVIGTWQIYQGIWIVLSKNEAGHYLISRSSDGRKTFQVVHDHDCEIYNIFWVDDGHAIFCAADGWFKTLDAGLTWEEMGEGPIASSAAIIPFDEGAWMILAYAKDHKIYSYEYPGEGEWIEDLDTTTIWSGKWHPAIAGNSVGVLAGVGGKLFRSTFEGWQEIQDLSSTGTIKSIVISSPGRLPRFMIILEPLVGDNDLIYFTDDLGDSLYRDASRFGAVASAQAVVPTGTNEDLSLFAVVGRRASSTAHSYRVV